METLGTPPLDLGIIPSASGFGAALSAQAAPGMVGAGAVLGKALMVGLASAAAVGAVAVTALFKVGQTFDQMSDTIRIGTGATGDALEALNQSAKNIGRDVPASFGDIGTAVADLNTRTGQTGAGLEALASQMLEMTRLTGGDLSSNIAAVTRVFGDWSVATGDQSETMDYLFKVSQSTGIGIDSLSQKVVQFGAPLRQLGFDFETSAALLGKWEKEGVNIETVLAGMKIGLGQMARSGLEPTEALREVQAAIAGAGSAGEANLIAIETFGQRAGPDMAAAIREGRFSVDELMSTLDASGETILGAAADTEDFAQKWTRFKNNVLIAIEPIATRMFDAFGTGMDWLSSTGAPAMSAFGAIVSEKVMPTMSSLGDFVTGTLVPAFRTFAAFITTNVVPVIRQMAAFFMANILPAIQSIAAFVTGTLVPAIMSFYQTVAENVIPIAQALWEQFTTNILPALQSVWAVISEKVVPVLIQLGEFLVPIISFIYEWAVKIAGFLIPIIVNLIGPILGGLIRVLGTVIGWVFDAIGAVIGFASALIEGGARAIEFGASVIDKVGEAVEWIRGVPGLISDAIGDLNDLLYDAGRAVITGLWDGMKSIWGNVTGWVSDAGSAISNGFKSVLGIASPSKVFASHGANIMLGLQGGLEAALPGLERTLAGVSATVAGTRLVATGGIASPDFGGRNVNGGGSSGRGLIDYDRLANAMSHVQIGLDGRAVSQSIDERIGAGLR